MSIPKLRQIAIQALNGIVPLSSTELAAERQKICNECEHHAHLANQCRLCWCFLDFKTKILEAECPANLW